MLEIKHLTVAYQRNVALQDINLKLERRRMVGLIGPNGAGKSTLLKAILGMVGFAGEVLIEGRPVRQNRLALAYVPQKEEVRWDFPVTVGDVVMMGRYRRIGWFKRPGHQDRQAVEDALALVGMSDFKNRQISLLSGGQQQRVFVARALAQQGHIILLDEPFTGIDTTSQDIIMKLLLRLREEGKLILMATHDLAAAGELCDCCALLNCRLVAFGPAKKVFQPQPLLSTFGSKVVTVGGSEDGRNGQTTTLVLE